MAYSKLYCESSLNKMAPLASNLWEREQQVAGSSLLFLYQWVIRCFVYVCTRTLVKLCVYDALIVIYKDE